MTEYIVHTKGSITVDAENREEAREKAMEESLNQNHEIFEYDATPLNPEEDKFQAKLSHVGSNKGNRSYKLKRDKSAMRLADSIVERTASSLVGGSKSQFRYDLAALIMASLEGDAVNKDEFWGLVQEINEKVHEEGYDEVLEGMWVVEE